MQVGDLVRYEDPCVESMLGLVTRVWSATSVTEEVMCEVWWTAYDNVGLHFSDELVLV